MKKFLARLWWVLQRDYYFTNEDAARERIARAYGRGIARGYSLAQDALTIEAQQIRAMVLQAGEDRDEARAELAAADDTIKVLLKQRDELRAERDALQWQVNGGNH